MQFLICLLSFISFTPGLNTIVVILCFLAVICRNLVWTLKPTSHLQAPFSVCWGFKQIWSVYHVIIQYSVANKWLGSEFKSSSWRWTHIQCWKQVQPAVVVLVHVWVKSARKTWLKVNIFYANIMSCQHLSGVAKICEHFQSLSLENLWSLIPSFFLILYCFFKTGDINRWKDESFTVCRIFSMKLTLRWFHILCFFWKSYHFTVGIY